MDTTTQVLNDRAFVIAWYGSCDNEPCQDFELANLTDDTGASALHRVSIIAEVDESHKTWKTFLPVTLSTNELTHFRCGHAYLIFMEDANDTGGVGNIKVPGLVVVDSATTEERLLTDVCGGGGGTPTPTATISFVNLVDTGDLRIGIEVDLTELYALCSSNEWIYTIRDSAGNIIHADVAAGINDSEVSGYVPLGDETYTVTIWGVSSNGMVLTPLFGQVGEVSDTISIGWPAPILGGLPDVVNRSYIEGHGPSDFQKLTLSKYLVKSLKFWGENLATAPLGQMDHWQYRIGSGQWETFDGSNVSVADGENEIYVRLKEGLSPNVADEHDASLVFEYEGENGNLYQKDIHLNGEVLDRVITISSLTDNSDSHAKVIVSKTNVYYYYYKIEAPTGQLWFDRSQSVSPPFDSGTTFVYINIGTYGEGAYKFTVWGVEEINGVWTTVTPEEEATVDMTWPNPTFPISGNVNESYVHGDGTSPGNSVLTRTDKWISSSKFYAPDNSGPVAWEYREFDQSNWQPVPTSLTDAGHRVPTYGNATPNNPSTNITWNDVSVHNKFVYRLKEDLPEGNYNMDVIYIGESLNGDPDLQVTKQLTGTVQPKPACCAGYPNTSPTTGDNSQINPIDNVKIYGFDADGSMCYHTTTWAPATTQFIVELKDSGGTTVGGGAMLVMGTLSNSEVTYQEPNQGACYRGNVTDDSTTNYLHEF